MTNMQKLGERLRKQAEKENCSVKELADLVGCDEMDILFLFDGERFLCYDSLVKVANRLHTTVSELLDVPNAKTDEEIRDIAEDMAEDITEEYGEYSFGGKSIQM